MTTANHNSLSSRALRLAVLRIGLVSICAGAISYFVNLSMVEDATRKQLLLSTEQTIQHESLPFREIKTLERNFLDEFKAIDTDPSTKPALVRDFGWIFYRNPNGSYTQRPGLFEGKSLPDGRRFVGASASYAPDIPPNDDIKARLSLTYILSHKYGSSTKGHLFNFYGVLPEKGSPIYQAIDLAKMFTYDGPEPFKFESYEFYYRSFGSPKHDTFLTRMYWDVSNDAWMTTVATPDVPDASGKHRIAACVDVPLDELMRHIAIPAIRGAHSMLFLADDDGTLIYHHEHMADVKRSKGHVSIKSLKLESDYALLNAAQSLPPGKIELVDTSDEIIAIGQIPETPWILSIRYPKGLMRPAILQNLAIVIALGMLTLLVEIFILRSILQNQVAIPLSRLIRATHLIGWSGKRLGDDALPVQSRDEIGELARDFALMAQRVEDAREHLERKVQERTTELEEANRKLTAMSATDELTGIANRRRFDEALTIEWRRAQRTESALALAMIDVDWFKKYNDHYGHQAGDDCLRNVARILRANGHRAGDLVARYGGEEFAIIATATSGENALKFAQSLCATLEQAALPHAASPFNWVTVSIGIAVMIPSADETADTLLKKADEALYKAKARGRNQAVLADS